MAHNPSQADANEAQATPDIELAEAIESTTQANQPVRLACKQIMLIVAEMRDKAISGLTAANELEEIVKKLKQRTGNGYEIVQPQVKTNG